MARETFYKTHKLVSEKFYPRVFRNAEGFLKGKISCRWWRARVSRIKSKVLWCIGNDRLLNQKERYGVDYYDGFMYSDCGHIILGVSNSGCGENSPLYTHLSDEMIVDVRYTVGLLKKFGK